MEQPCVQTTDHTSAREVVYKLVYGQGTTQVMLIVDMLIFKITLIRFEIILLLYNSWLKLNQM